MQREVFIKYDLENFPLQIKTNSSIGSGERVKMTFYNSANELTGAIVLSFSLTPRYYLHFCDKSLSNIPTALPSETDKVWKITLNKTLGIRVTIHCNLKEVLNIEMSLATCSDGRWIFYWDGDVEKIKFHKDDTASDYYYRPGMTFVFRYLIIVM